MFVFPDPVALGTHLIVIFVGHHIDVFILKHQ